MTGGDTDSDVRIGQLAAQLETLQSRMGETYWTDDEVRQLREDLRHELGAYGAWGADRPGMHQRARRAAALERQYARLLWPW